MQPTFENFHYSLNNFLYFIHFPGTAGESIYGGKFPGQFTIVFFISYLFSFTPAKYEKLDPLCV